MGVWRRYLRNNIQYGIGGCGPIKTGHHRLPADHGIGYRHILSRTTLRYRVDRIGQQGIFGGSLNVPHALAVDSKGNLYVGENFDGRRFQRFVYKGMGAPTGKTLPPPKP